MTLTQRIRLSRRHGGLSQATLADLVEDDQEVELLRAYRETSPQSRMVLVELAQQLARQRLGHRVARPTTLMHALGRRIGDDDPAPLG